MEINHVKIGIVSENYKNDGEPIAMLLGRYLKGKAVFMQFCKNLNGNQLDTFKAFTMLENECKKQKPDIVLFIRDLDSDKKQKLRTIYFEKCKSCIEETQTVFLLFVYEIEALALADLKTVEAFYHLKKPIQFTKTPEKQTNPKGFLQENTTYSESDMRELVQIFNLNELKTYTVWNDFIENISSKI